MIDYKYNEEALINELQEYVDGTYQQHYSQNKFQATEFIIDGGHGEGFALGNILKYSQRYGKKAGKNRNDLLKVLHYALIALHVHDKEHADPKSGLTPIPDKEHADPKSGLTPIPEKATEWDEGGPRRVPDKRDKRYNTRAQVLVQKCTDPRKWYADKIGKIVDIISEDEKEFKAVDDGGYINFISKRDAVRV
jgi:hypothetical protein